MIKQIIFKNTDSLTSESTIINFNKEVNIIIGPKGGGKSTLFDLVAGLKESYIPKNVVDALASFGLEFTKAIKFNGEEVNANNLRTITSAEKKKMFEGRNDVIYQDDEIKKNLNNRKEIEKAKNNFVKDKCENSPTIETFIKKIKNLYYGMDTLAKRNKEVGVNWTNLFSVKKNIDTKVDVILKLNYSNMTLETKIKNLRDELKEIKNNYESQILKNHRFLTKEWNDKLIDRNYVESLNNSLKEITLKTKQILEQTEKEIRKINKIKLMSKLFQKAYKKQIDLIQKENFGVDGIKSFLIKSKDHFKNMAREVQMQKQRFESLLGENIKIPFDESTTDNKLLSYKMPSSITLKDDDIYSLLKVVWVTPGSSVSDITKWLEAMIKKGIKPFDRNKIVNKLAKIFQEQVMVLANGEIYEHMSLGQKSIYGIQYKFNNSKGQDLFLDQPEDNLDNFTIANDILKLINSRKEQVFIVTHNANIGLLSQAGTTIVADLNNENNKYAEGTIVKTQEKDSDAAHFLEGGTVYLKRRYEVIEGNKHAINNK